MQQSDAIGAWEFGLFMSQISVEGLTEEWLKCIK